MISFVGTQASNGGIIIYYHDNNSVATAILYIKKKNMHIYM